MYLLAASAHAVLNHPKLPAQLPAGLADELPESPGVYRFYGEDAELLLHRPWQLLRGKILSQLAEPRAGSREQVMAQLVQRVDWRQTAGELGAMLLESHRLKPQQPRYNRYTRSNADSVTLKPADASGRVRIERLDMLEPEDFAESFGVFHSEKDARKALNDIARASQLCLKVLGLEDSEGSCFALQMGKCRGVCAPARNLFNPALDAREIGGSVR